MGLILAVLVLVLVFGAIGFVVHLLWIAAVIALVLWLLGFLVRGAPGVAGTAGEPTGGARPPGRPRGAGRALTRRVLPSSTSRTWRPSAA